MPIKTKAPKIEEDPETKRLRQQAEARAEATRISELQDSADSATQKLLKRFGVRAPSSGATAAMTNFNPFIASTAQGITGFGSTSNTATAPRIVRRSSGGSSLVRGYNVISQF